jgi:hypothetical protein
MGRALLTLRSVLRIHQRYCNAKSKRYCNANGRQKFSIAIFPKWQSQVLFQLNSTNERVTLRLPYGFKMHFTQKSFKPLFATIGPESNPA